tara:strand:+ start:7033 stop:7254 length:222 start_codon:yes stop_codon:yes gene_type:complete
MSDLKVIKLSGVDVELKKDGSVELVYSHITADEFKKTMDSKLPEYENTEILYGFIKRLKNLTDVYREEVNKLL